MFFTDRPGFRLLMPFVADDPPIVPTFEEIQAMRRQAKMVEISFFLNQPPARLWPFVSNADQLDRMSGLKPVSYEFKYEKDGTPHRFGSTRNSGLPMRYYEFDYEIKEPDYYFVERVTESGPMTYFKFAAEFAASNTGGTVVNLSLLFVPRTRFLDLPFLYMRNLRKMEAALNVMSENIPARQNILGFEAFLEIDDGTAKKIERLNLDWKDLMPDSAVPEKVAEFMITAPDSLAHKVRPYLVARYFDLPREETLRFFLIATKHGFLDLSWDVLCPSCEGAKQRVPTLSDLASTTHCESCNIEYDADFASNVEITFRPAGSVRKVKVLEYCFASPANTPHIAFQTILSPRERRQIPLNLPAGAYRVASRSSPNVAKAYLSNHANGRELSFDPTHPQDDRERGLQTGFTLELINHKDTWQTFSVERVPDHKMVITAAEVTSIQEFRDLFDAEVLRPGAELKVSNIILMFSDLRDSTSLYDKEGDARAFKLVQDHFDIMLTVIRRHQGAIVKTIGDAVMATFSDSGHALSAAFEILEEIEAWNAQNRDRDAIQVKLGVHMGAVIAINLNGKLDYFGSVVNKAARIEGTSKGADIVVSRDLFESPAAQAALRKMHKKAPVKVRRFRAQLRGIEEEKELYRLSIS